MTWWLLQSLKHKTTCSDPLAISKGWERNRFQNQAVLPIPKNIHVFNIYPWNIFMGNFDYYGTSVFWWETKKKKKIFCKIKLQTELCLNLLNSTCLVCSSLSFLTSITLYALDKKLIKFLFTFLESPRGNIHTGFILSFQFTPSLQKKRIK